MPAGQSMWRRPVAEFLAIFAGVSLSLLADDWRDRRADARAELAALQLISADLIRDSAEIEYAFGPAARYREPALWLVAHWDDPDMDADILASRMEGPLTDNNQYRPLSAAYSSLKEAGGLDLIQNEALRAAIVEYFDYTQSALVWYLDEANESFYDLITRMSRYARLPEPENPERPVVYRGAWAPRSRWSEIHGDTELVNRIHLTAVWGYYAGRRRDQALAANLRVRTEIAEELSGK